MFDSIITKTLKGQFIVQLTHSKRFINEFRTAAASTIYNALKNYLASPLPCTGRPPPVVVACDKMTEKHRTGQLTSIGTIQHKASATNLVNTYFLGSPIVRAHDGAGLAEAVVKELKKNLNPETISTQLVGGGTDGQYFKLHVDRHLIEILGLLKAFFSWDLVHRANLGEGDVKEMTKPNKELVHPYLAYVISCVKDLLNYAKFGKKYEHLLKTAEKYPNEKFYKLHSVSTTRFPGYFHLVIWSLLKDIKFFFEALEEASLLVAPKPDDEAKRLLRRIRNVKFLGYLSALTDLYSVLGEVRDQVEDVL